MSENDFKNFNEQNIDGSREEYPQEVNAAAPVMSEPTDPAANAPTAPSVSAPMAAAAEPVMSEPTPAVSEPAAPAASAPMTAAAPVVSEPTPAVSEPAASAQTPAASAQTAVLNETAAPRMAGTSPQAQSTQAGNVNGGYYSSPYRTEGYYGSGYYRTEAQTGYSSWQNRPFDNAAADDGKHKKTKKIKAEKKPKEKKSKGRAGFAAGIIAAALIVGLGSGMAGSMLANRLSIGSGDGSSTLAPTSSESRPINNVPSLESSPATATPLDKDKIEDTENQQLLSASELYAKVRTSVAVVYKYTNVRGYDEPVKTGLASGVVFTSDGYVITNAHVVDGAAKLTVVIFDSYDSDSSHEYEAEILGADEASDLAVIKITRDEPFDYAKLGNSDALRVGQDVCVIGNPVNNTLASTLTKGIVSGLERGSLTGSAYSCKSIQIDAAVNGGNSGGGLFDMYGNVVGIIDYKITYTLDGSVVENIGFAITINEAKPIIEDLMTLGYVSNRPGLGINGEMLGDYMAYMYGYPSNGLRVTYIDESMPVSKSGLKVGDVITKINDVEVTSMSDIQNEISNHSIGDTVELTVLRANEIGNIKEQKVTVELAELKLDA